MMTIIDHLKKDHRKIEMLYKQMDDLRPEDHATRHKLFLNLHSLIEAQARSEEENFYDRFITRKDMRRQLLEYHEVHQIIGALLKEMSLLSPRDEKWHAKFNVLKDILHRHIQEEEEVLFPKVAAHVEKDILDSLSDFYIERRNSELNKLILTLANSVLRDSQSSNMASY